MASGTINTGRLNASSMQLTTGDQAAGRVLTSDANGLASWQPPAVGSLDAINAAIAALQAQVAALILGASGAPAFVGFSYTGISVGAGGPGMLVRVINSAPGYTLTLGGVDITAATTLSVDALGNIINIGDSGTWPGIALAPGLYDLVYTGADLRTCTYSGITVY